jgi:hypothetical protein
MGSRSRLLVDTSDGVRVSGGVRLVGTGTLELPAAPGQARSSSPGSAWIYAS